jgi:hypothetical protein
MGTVDFDDAAADNLVQAATSAADVLRSQGTARRSAVEDAAEDFDGAYATRFTESAQTESEDRPKLASVLDDLGEQVMKVKKEAEAERKRLSDLAAWETRQEERRRAEAASPLGAIGLPQPAPFDFKPSESAVRPTPIDAAFAPRGRMRTGGGTASGRSAADPEKLRSFASIARAEDIAARAKAAELKHSWNAFTTACAWASVGSVTFLQGFDRLLDENGADAAWIERIAAAFERAGGHGALSNVVLDAADADVLPAGLQNLFDSGLTPADVAALWTELGYTRDDSSDLAALPPAALNKLGNLEGVPYWVRSTVNIAALDQRIAEAKNYLDNLNRPSYQNHPELAENARNLGALENIKKALAQGDRAGERSLVSLTGDEPPLAAIGIGDLDTAKTVSWAVPGMNSATDTMADWATAGQNLLDEQTSVTGPEDSHAVVAWMGYDSPPIPLTPREGVDLGVWGTSYAKAGGDKLADALRGFDATRSGSDPTVNVVAHSYGTTTAAYGLTKAGVHVDSFTTLASAGIPDSIPNADALHADHVFAGQARNVMLQEFGQGDPLAGIGRGLSDGHKQDPTEPSFGATTFGADGTGELERVASHNVHAGDSGYLDGGTESLRNVALATTGQQDLMTPYVPKGLTPYERMVLFPFGEWFDR